MKQELLSVAHSKKYFTTDIEELEYRLRNHQDISDFYERISWRNTMRVMFTLYYDLSVDYLTQRANEFTQEREIITLTAFFKRVFNDKCIFKDANLRIPEDLTWAMEKIIKIVTDEYQRQVKEFPASNFSHISYDNEVWRLFWSRGPSLNSRVFDFTKIHSNTLRKEVMAFFRKKLMARKNFRNDGQIAILTRCLNFLISNNPKIRYCSDIRKKNAISLVNHLEYTATTQYGESLAVKTFSQAIGSCRALLDFLIKQETHPLKYPKPNNNPFADIEFKDLLWHGKRTEIIPEMVIDQMGAYLDELSKPIYTAYKVLESTGMRISEVTKLEAGCIDYNDEYKVWTISYIPNKISAHRKKNRLPKEHLLVIPETVARLVQEIESESENIRTDFHIPYIFVRKRGSDVPRQMQSDSMALALNKITKKHQVVDDDGQVWHFTSRQYRKTIAVNMVENGATLQELASQFAHIGVATGMLYYAEVRRKRLADLNHAFFEKKFNLVMGEEKLSKFTEEERKYLYADFCMSQREVEYGVCVKHFSEGPCGKRTGKSNCATCTKLCTGVKYLDKWNALLSSQRAIVNELLDIYKKNGIEDYSDFREFQREKFLLDAYTDVVKKITGGK